MKIINRPGAATISGNTTYREIPTDCPKCAEVNLRFPLRERRFLPNEIIPPDAKQWLQCWHCNYIIAKQDIPQKGQLTTDIERVDSRYQVPGTIVTAKDDRRGIISRGKNERERRKADDIKDEEVKRALRKGEKLLSYTEKL